jgi:hypothetical protein
MEYIAFYDCCRSERIQRKPEKEDKVLCCLALFLCRSSAGMWQSRLSVIIARVETILDSIRITEMTDALAGPIHAMSCQGPSLCYEPEYSWKGAQ